MSHPIRCVQCQVSLQESHAGRCPACGHQRIADRGLQIRDCPPNWWVTESAPPTTAAAEWWAKSAPPPLPVVAEVSAPTPPTGVKTRPMPLWLAVGGALALAVFACTLAVMALPKRNGSTPPVVELTETNSPQPQPPELGGKPGPLVQAHPVMRVVEPVAEEGPLPRRDEQVMAAPSPIDPPAPVVEKAKPAPVVPAKLVVKRRADVSEDDLARQLEKAPELRLDRTIRRLESEQLVALGKKARLSGSDDLAVSILEKRTDLAGMPWLKGDDCKISPTAANNLQDGSLALRDFMSDVSRAGRPILVGRTGRPDPGRLNEQLTKDGRDHNRWLKTEAIPALQQLLMAEDESVREVLVDQLARIEGKKASVALAQRALFDLHPRVRERALMALENRPVAEYRDTLLGGFHYPWSPVAEHAAEAIVALKMKDAVTPLISFLDMPAPTAPYRDETKGTVVKEMVRVNHLLNCVMCHAPSTKPDDKVRGRMPSTTQPLPPAFSRQYYADNNGTFVRAEVTYLRQDFSVPMKVSNPGVWPEVQRFDFLVRERPALPADMNTAKKPDAEATPHQQAIFFALRELTGTDPGPRVEDWKKQYLGRKLEVSSAVTGLKNARALATDRDGNLFISDGETILRKTGDAKPTAWLTDFAGAEALAFDAKGKLLAVQGKLGRVLGIDVESKATTTRAGKLESKPLTHPRRVAADAGGGFYFTDDADPNHVNDRGAVHYVSAHGSLTRLPVTLARPRAIALSPDGKTLVIAPASGSDIMTCAVTSAGSLGKGKRLARIEGGIADLGIDSAGNVGVLVASEPSVVVLSPMGAKLAVARLADAPIACAVRDTTMHVLTKKAVYRLELRDVDATRTASR